MQLFKSPHSKSGFTLMEIMIVVSIIGLLATVAVPNYLRARKRGQAVQILADLKQLDGAIQLYYLENNKTDASAVTNTDLIAYIKPGTRLALANGKDIFGNDFIILPPDRIPKVHTSTFNVLSAIAPRSFWSPHIQ
jgi:prepilin-type N-terminal cleavage/methylation domain-containing protein